MNLKERLKQQRAYAQALADKLHKSSWLIAEEINLKIFATYELKHFHIPIKGTFFSDVSLIEHYRKIRARWSLVTVGDNRIEVVDDMGEQPDDIDILDEIGIMNLENAMER